MKRVPDIGCLDLNVYPIIGPRTKRALRHTVFFTFRLHRLGWKDRPPGGSPPKSKACSLMFGRVSDDIYIIIALVSRGVRISDPR